MNSRAWMPFYVGDYLRDTGHLTTEQHGAYVLLIAHCWTQGCVPLDPQERAAIARLTPDRWQEIGAPINRLFCPDGTHKRVTKEREKADANVAKKVIAANIRWKRRAGG